MTFWKPTWLLTLRALIQFPRNPAVLMFSLAPPVVQLLLFGSIFENLTQLPGFPVDNYFTYLTPGVVFFTTIIGIANAGVALVQDFQNRYFLKILVAPVSMWSILMGRLLSDGLRVFLTAGVVFLIGLLLGAKLASGPFGFFMILLLATLFAIFGVGVLVTIVALKTKDQQATQAVFPVFFILTFLTTAFMPKNNIGSDLLKTIIDANPAEYVIRPMHTLMFESTPDWGEMGVAFAVIGALALVGIVLTRLTFRTVYK